MKFPLSSLHDRCLATLAYFDLFDYPLTLEELERYFLGEQPSRKELADFLKTQGHRIQQQDGYYFFNGRDHIVMTREEREKISKNYWKKARWILPLIQMIPFVRMTGVCNSLAFNNASAESDIDLFIVAQTGRLFIVRFYTIFLFGLLGVRRHGNKIAGRFCLSFYVDENALNLENIQSGKDDIYLPYWVLTMQPLYGRKTYEKFVQENAWISGYFGRTLSLVRDFWRPSAFRAVGWLKEIFLKGAWGDNIEKKLRKIQLSRHERHLSGLPLKASIVVSDHMLKFHNIDRRSEISKRFEAKLRSFL